MKAKYAPMPMVLTLVHGEVKGNDVTFSVKTADGQTWTAARWGH